MKALLRPTFAFGLSIAIAATGLVGASSVAFAANLSKPLITSRSLDGLVYEGDKPFLNGTFTDGTDEGPYTVDVDWGDGTSEQYALADLGARTFRVQKTDAYASDGALTIFVTVSDPMFSNLKTLPVTVLNAAPSFSSFGLSATNLEAGGAVTATGAFTDGGANDTHTVTLNWGDGSIPTTAPAVSPFTTDPHTYMGVGNFEVTATVTDNAGATAVATSTVTVNAPNQAPTIVSFGVTAGNEGGNSTLALTFADVDALDTHTVSVAWGDGSPSDSAVELVAGVTTFDAAHVYADNGSYSVVLTLNDSAGHTVTASASVSPTNVGPVMGSLTLSPTTVVDHQTLTVSGSFTDPGTADTFTLTIDWGDGSTSTQFLDTARSFSATHAYDASGPVTITVTVEDRDHARSSAGVDLVVESSNHAPNGLSFESSTTGANLVLTGAFTDADADDTHTVTLNWGDGASTSQFLAAGATTFAASHVYGASDTYTVTATVTDPDGASTSVTAQVSVTVSAGSASDVIDEMTTLVQSFGLAWHNERWLVRKLNDLKDSLAYGNTQVCSSTGLLSHILAFAERTLTAEQYAELSAAAIGLKAAAGCAGDASRSPKVLRAATVTTTVTPALPQPLPTQRKDAPTKAKSAKSDSKPAGGRSSH
jgi:PKD repeat protein